MEGVGSWMRAASLRKNTKLPKCGRNVLTATRRKGAGCGSVLTTRSRAKDSSGEETEERERGVLHLHHVHEVPRALLARCEAAQDSELLSRGHGRREEQPVHPLPPTWEYHIYLPAFGTGSEGGVERAQRGTPLRRAREG